MQATAMPPQIPNEKTKHAHKKAEHNHPVELKNNNNTSSSLETAIQSTESSNFKSTSPDSASAPNNNRVVECANKGGGGSVENGRERLKRHRVEVAGRVWIPDMWGQEGLLKDWIDCTAFDASLMNSSIMSARAALVEEAGRRRTAANPGAVPRVIRLENSC